MNPPVSRKAAILNPVGTILILFLFWAFGQRVSPFNIQSQALPPSGFFAAGKIVAQYAGQVNGGGKK